MFSYFRKYRLHYRSLLTIGVPIMVGQVGIILTGFVDNIMVGHHMTEELAAASFVNNIFMLPFMFASGFAMGITPLIGKETGRNSFPQAGQIFRCGFLFNGLLSLLLILIMGTLYFFLGRMGLPPELLPLIRPYYLLQLVGLVPMLLFNAFKQFADGTTDTLTPMFILLTGNLVNIIGNALLIYGFLGFPEWGLLGAGVSTLTARVFILAVGLWLFLCSKRYHRFKGGFLHLPGNRFIYRQVFFMGLPIALQLGMETASFSLSTLFVGWIGATALAAHQAAITFSTIGFLLYTGIGAAITILISNAEGNGHGEEARPITKAGAHIVLTQVLVVSLIMLATRHYIGYIFTDSVDVAEVVSAIIIPMIVYQVGDGMQITLAGALRGLGIVKPMVWMAFVSYFIISLPFSYFFAFGCNGGAPGVWWGYPIGLSSAALLYFQHFYRKSQPSPKRE